MGRISEIFNFDNIGGKIKNLAKWSCWITILLIWIAAPISFIALVAEEYTAELCWIPLVSAIVGPVFVWLGSWAMYAFGEFVEDVHAIRNKEGTTESVPPVAISTTNSSAQKVAHSPAQKVAHSPVQDSTRPIAADEWKCTCGRINKRYVSSCACGTLKRDAMMNRAQND